MGINLADVHPELMRRVTLVLNAMAALGFPMKAIQGVRTVEEQARLYAQGRTMPGKVVTNDDGIKNKSPHQVRADGLGHAVDCCFTIGDPFGEKQPWNAYGACVEAVGLTWGGRFHSLVDRPHAEFND